MKKEIKDTNIIDLKIVNPKKIKSHKVISKLLNQNFAIDENIFNFKPHEPDRIYVYKSDSNSDPVKYNEMNIFPFFLIGKVVAEFETSYRDFCLEGVGVLIGPEVVLTVAHLLTTQDKDENITQPKRVHFYPSLNANFVPINNLKSNKTKVSSEYLKALKNCDKGNLVNNDWGLIFFNYDIGEKLISLYGAKDLSELTLSDDGLYNFFYNNDYIEVDNNLLVEQNVTMIGYPEIRKIKQINIPKPKHLFYSESDMANMQDFRHSYGPNELKSIKEESESDSKKVGDNTINIKILLDDHDYEPQSSHLPVYKSNQVITTKNCVKSETDIISLAQEQDISQKIAKKIIVRTPDRKHLIMTKNLEAENGFDYIIFNDEKLNDRYHTSEKEKIILTECKANLIEVNDLKYIMTDYKGRAGAPVFFRSKNRSSNPENKELTKTLSEDEFEEKKEYIYKFMGIHTKLEPDENYGICHTCETNFSDSANSIYNTDDHSKKDGLNNFSGPLNLLGEQSKKVIEVIREENSNKIKSKPNKQLDTDFVSVKLKLNEEEKLSGIFRKTSSLYSLFILGGQILHIKKEFVLLIKSDNATELIQNFNYDKDKELRELIDINSDTSSLEFELALNVKKYGEYVAKKAFLKFLETYGLEIDKFQKYFEKRYSKKFYQMIFAEVKIFENVYPIYGQLFNKIKETVSKLTTK